jgi:hypothetical protein
MLFRYGARAGAKTNGGLRMRKLIIATAALAFISSTAFAQTSTTPAAGGDTMSKGDTMKKAPKKAKKSAKKTDDATKDTTKQ